jgi:hypothetical protein
VTAVPSRCSLCLSRWQKERSRRRWSSRARAGKDTPERPSRVPLSTCSRSGRTSLFAASPRHGQSVPLSLEQRHPHRVRACEKGSCTAAPGPMCLHPAAHQHGGLTPRCSISSAFCAHRA